MTVRFMENLWFEFFALGVLFFLLSSTLRKVKLPWQTDWRYERGFPGGLKGYDSQAVSLKFLCVVLLFFK